MRSHGGALLLGAILLASCGYHAGEDEAEEAARAHAHRIDAKGRIVLSAEERETLDLQTTVVKRGTLAAGPLRFGRVSVRPQDDGLIVAPVTGRLGPPALALGARTSKNSLVARLQPVLDTASAAGLETRANERQGQVTAAQAQIRALSSELERVSALASSNLATEAEKARAEADLEAEKARLKSLQQAGDQLARITATTIELRAPFEGTLADIDTATGSLVGQGTVVARVVRDGPRWINLAVPPGEPTGTIYRVHGPTRLFEAKLINQGTTVQSDGTRRDRIEVETAAADELLPGAIVSVEVLHETSGLLAPQEAIVRWGAKKLVFVEVEPDRFEARPVQIGARDAGTVALTSGLTEGESVVVQGTAALLGEIGQEQEPPNK